MNSGMIRPMLVALVFALTSCRVPVQQGLDEGAANDVLGVLERAGLSARKSQQEGSDAAKFAVSVAQSDVPRALDVLKANGLPRASAGGFDAVYGDGSLIPSPTEDRARFLRALAGELENTLTAAEGIVAARVHLVAEERDVLAGRDDPPRVAARAAVLLKVQDGRGLRDEDVRTLLVGSVPGLAATNVAIVRTSAPALASSSDTLVALGPLRVAPASKAPLLVGLTVGLGLLALMAVLLLATARRLAALEPSDSRPEP